MRAFQIDAIDRPISVIGLGTMIFSKETRDRDHRILDAFVDHGGTFVDSAEIYGAEEEHGYSELVIGEWLMKSPARRDEIVLASKGLVPGTCTELHPGGAELSPKGIHAAIDGSLQRLGTDYLDVWMLHRDDETQDVAVFVEAMAEEVKRGRIRAYGGSNWSTQRLGEAIAYAKAHNLPAMSVASPQYSLAKPSEPYWPNTVAMTGADERWYSEHRLPAVAWSSLGRGFFAKGDPNFADDQDLVRVFYSDANFERKRRAQQLADARGATVFEIALAYVTSQEFPVVALSGAATPEEAGNSTTAGDIQLTSDERDWLNLATDVYPGA